jgi:hypothetical protein
MSLAKGKSKKAVSARFHEFRHGKTYVKTERKYGKAVANKQLVAVSLGDRNGKKKSTQKRKAKAKGASKDKAKSSKKRIAKRSASKRRK